MNKTQERKVTVKYYLMNIAHLIDVFRGIPRLMVLGYGYLVWDSVAWFQTLPDPTNAHTFLISTIVGGAAAVFGLYVNSGAQWDDQKSARRELYTTPHVGKTSPNIRTDKLPPRRSIQNYQFDIPQEYRRNPHHVDYDTMDN